MFMNLKKMFRSLKNGPKLQKRMVRKQLFNESSLIERALNNFQLDKYLKKNKNPSIFHWDKYSFYLVPPKEKRIGWVMLNTCSVFINEYL